LEDDDADENMRCKRREHHRQWASSSFFGANFGHLATKNKGGRRGAANWPKDFFSGKKGPQSPYLEHW
jgi:hypothetical protein